jgi:hypothetical protein
MGPKRGLQVEGAQDYYILYRENSQKRDFSKSDSEKFLVRKFYVGRGGLKEPPGGIIYFWVLLSPNGVAGVVLCSIIDYCVHNKPPVLEQKQKALHGSIPYLYLFPFLYCAIPALQKRVLQKRGAL